MNKLLESRDRTIPCFYLDRYGSSLDGPLESEIKHSKLRLYRFDIDNNDDSAVSRENAGVECCRVICYRILESLGKTVRGSTRSRLFKAREKALWDELRQCSHESHGHILLNACVALLHEQSLSHVKELNYSTAFLFGCASNDEFLYGWLARYFSHGVSPYIGLIAIVNTKLGSYIKSDDWVHIAHGLGDVQSRRFEYLESSYPGLQFNFLPKKNIFTDWQDERQSKDNRNVKVAISAIPHALVSFPELKRHYLNYMEAILASHFSDEIRDLIAEDMNEVSAITLPQAHDILSVQSLALTRTFFPELYRCIAISEARSGRDLIDRVLFKMGFGDSILTLDEELTKTFSERVEEFWRLISSASSTDKEKEKEKEKDADKSLFDQLEREITSYRNDASELTLNQEWDSFCFLMFHTINTFVCSNAGEKYVDSQDSSNQQGDFLPTLYQYLIPGIIQKNKGYGFPHDIGSVLHLTLCIEREQNRIADRKLKLIFEKLAQVKTARIELEPDASVHMSEEQLEIFNRLHILDAHVVQQAMQVSHAASLFVSCFQDIIDEFYGAFGTELCKLLHDCQFTEGFDSSISSVDTKDTFSQTHCGDYWDAIRKKSNQNITTVCERLIAGYPLPILQQGSNSLVAAAASIDKTDHATNISTSDNDDTQAADKGNTTDIEDQSLPTFGEENRSTVDGILALYYASKDTALKGDDHQISELKAEVRATAEQVAMQVLDKYKKRISSLEAVAEEAGTSTKFGTHVDIILDTQLIDEMAFGTDEIESELKFASMGEIYLGKQDNINAELSDSAEEYVDILRLLLKHSGALSDYVVPHSLLNIVEREKDKINRVIFPIIDFQNTFHLYQSVDDMTVALRACLVFLNDSLIAGNLIHVDRFCKKWREVQIAQSGLTEVVDPVRQSSSDNGHEEVQQEPPMNSMMEFSNAFPELRRDFPGAEKLSWFEDLLKGENKRTNAVRTAITADVGLLHSSAMRLFLDVVSESELFWDGSGDVTSKSDTNTNKGLIESVLSESLLAPSRTKNMADSLDRDNSLMQWLFRADKHVQTEIHRLNHKTQRPSESATSNDRFLERLLLKVHGCELAAQDGSESEFSKHWNDDGFAFRNGPYFDFYSSSPCIVTANVNTDLDKPQQLFDSMNKQVNPFVKVFVCYASKDGSDLFQELKNAVETHNKEKIDKDNLPIMLITDQDLKFSRSWVSQLSAGLDIADKVILISTPWSRMQHVQGKRFIRYFELERIRRRLIAGNKSSFWRLDASDLKLVTNELISVAEWESFYGEDIAKIAEQHPAVIANKQVGMDVETAKREPTIGRDMGEMVREIGKKNEKLSG